MWSIINTVCVGTFLFQNISFILKNACPHCLEYHPIRLCLSTVNALHELSSFGGPSAWLRPSSSLMWILSFLCHWNFFYTWFLLLLLFFFFASTSPFVFYLFPEGWKDVTFLCWNTRGLQRSLFHLFLKVFHSNFIGSQLPNLRLIKKWRDEGGNWGFYKARLVSMNGT